MSGNIGLQCSTVLIRIMAMGGLSAGSRKETIMKEFLSGLFTGSIFGVACGLLVYLVDLVSGGALGSTTPGAVSAIVSFGLIGGCFAGTLLGVFSPLFFARIGVDPAIAAGPIVTAFNDFLSMTIYFGQSVTTVTEILSPIDRVAEPAARFCIPTRVAELPHPSRNLIALPAAVFTWVDGIPIPLTGFSSPTVVADFLSSSCLIITELTEI